MMGAIFFFLCWSSDFREICKAENLRFFEMLYDKSFNYFFANAPIYLNVFQYPADLRRRSFMSKFYWHFNCFSFSGIFSGNGKELIRWNSYKIWRRSQSVWFNTPYIGENYFCKLRLSVCCLQMRVHNLFKTLRMQPFTKKS